MKQLNDLNLETLSSGLGSVLSSELGGTFSVTVQKFERTGSSWPSANGLLLQFLVQDESSTERYMATRIGRYALPLDEAMTADEFRKATLRVATDEEITYDARPLGSQQKAGILTFLDELAIKNRDNALTISKPIVFFTDDLFETTEELDGIIQELGKAGLGIRMKQVDSPRPGTD